MKRNCNLMIHLFLVVLLSTVFAFADDWPQYRSDSSRSGYTSESLPGELALNWKRAPRHAPDRAWVGRSMARSRMKFDWAYSVVIEDGTCYFGSSADHKIYALDAETGAQKWSFFTGGPVRFAPALWKNRLFAVSDDGFLYCLDAETGAELWKVRGGPSNEKVIGNGRMVSRWVARGGPAVRDGVVYFGAGIWPADGVYIKAVDAQSGRVLWCNDSAGVLEIDQPHMGAYSRGGVIAQGYLALNDEQVFVMSGRSVPGVFDRETGDFLYYHLSRYGGKTPWGVGGGDVVADEDVFFTAGFAFDTATGLKYHKIGDRNWWERVHKNGQKYHGEFYVGERQTITCVPGGYVRSEGGKVCGSKLKFRDFTKRRELESSIETERLEALSDEGNGYMEAVNQAPVLVDEWSLNLGGSIADLVVAGDTIALAKDSSVVLLDRKTREVLWSLELDEEVYTLAVADGSLYASAESGAIYCFSEPDQARNLELVERSKRNRFSEDASFELLAEEIIERSERTAGYCLDLGCGDGALIRELAERTDLYLVGISSDPAQVAEARSMLDSAGLYGERAVVLLADPAQTGLPDYFANLIVSTDLALGDANLLAERRVRSEIKRLQRPNGGTLCLGKLGSLRTDRRPALKGAGEWTHPHATPGNILCSGDKIAKGPLGMLWYQDETLETIDRHGKNPSPLYKDGVLVREGVNAIYGMDAYNGRELWRVSIPDLLEEYIGGTGLGATQIGNTLCIAGRTVYVRNNNKCILLDLYSGERKDEFRGPGSAGNGWRDWTYIACEDGILYGAMANTNHNVRCQHGGGKLRTQVPNQQHYTESSLLFAMDAETGELKWKYEPLYSIRNNSIAVGNGRIYFIDRPLAEMDRILRIKVSKMLRSGEAESLPEHPAGKLLALDGESGESIWEKQDVRKTTLTMSAADDALVMSYNPIGRPLPSDMIQHGMEVFDAADGELLWSDNARMLWKQRPMIIDGYIYQPAHAVNILNGDPLMVTNEAGETAQWSFQDQRCGCGPLAGSENILVGRAGAMGYYDLVYDPGRYEYFGGIRSGCWINMLPVGGIVLAPDDTRACRCSYQNQATIALKEHGVRAPWIDPLGNPDNYVYNRLKKAHFFKGEIDFEITHQRDDVQIRYTLDGSVPESDSPLYSGAVTISETTPVRAAAFREGRKLAERNRIVFTEVDDLKAAWVRGKKKRYIPNK